MAMYAMIATHPNISGSGFNEYMPILGKKHWEALKGIMRYLKTISSKCICYGSQDKGYTSSNYARDLDKIRSTFGYVYYTHW